MRKLLLAIILCLIPSIGLCGGITQQHMAILGMYDAASGACANNPATDYVGDKTDYSAQNYPFSADTLLCVDYTSLTSTCATGTFSYASAHVSYNGTSAKICLYTDDGDGAADSGDALVGCATITAGETRQWTESAAEINQPSSSTTDYWICIVANADLVISRTTSGSRTVYYGTTAGWYTNPPDPMPNGLSTTASRDYMWFVKIR